MAKLKTPQSWTYSDLIEVNEMFGIDLIRKEVRTTLSTPERSFQEKKISKGDLQLCFFLLLPTPPGQVGRLSVSRLTNMFPSPGGGGTEPRAQHPFLCPLAASNLVVV